jgi:hypothetical protein
MNRIELSGKSQGKGRNGYFQLHSVELMNIPTDPDGQVLNIDFYPRRRVNCVGPARLLLNVEDATKLAQFLGEAVESRPPVANIEHGELVCECGHRGTPRLEESGYQVSHALVEIVGDTIIASGWDGSSRAVSEDGDAYWLMCDGCGKLHPLPPDAAYRLEVRCSESSCGWSHDHIPQLFAGFLRRRRVRPGASSR